MLTALTRKVSPALGRCELEYLPRQEIDIGKARVQHEQYEACLAELGLRVVSLPAEPDLPDSMFVEDPAVVVDEVAVIARMGNQARRGESNSIAKALEPYRKLCSMSAPATLEGGDVLRVGRRVFVGMSTRTNRVGAEQLASALGPHGYSVTPVEVRRCLHLKSACCYLGNGAILANRAWVDITPFEEFRIVDVAPDEPGAANVLALGETVIAAAAYPATVEILGRLGYRIRTLDISELMKAEAALTCSSLIFE
jgi:dimethylargininase